MIAKINLLVGLKDNSFKIFRFYTRNM